MNRKLALQINRFNPKWSKLIKDFLNTNTSHLPTSSMPYDDDIPDKGLDLNKGACCIIGEIWNFDNLYGHTGIDGSCSACEYYGMELWRLNRPTTKESFAIKLQEAYTHIASSHKELIKPRKSTRKSV